MLNAIAAIIADSLRGDNLSPLEQFDHMNCSVRWAIISYMAGIPRPELDLMRIEVFYRVTGSLIVSIQDDPMHLGESLEQRLVSVIQQFEIDEQFCHQLTHHSPLTADEMTALARLPMTLLEFLVQVDVSPPCRLRGASREAIVDFFVYLHCVATFSYQDVLDKDFINDTLNLEESLSEAVRRLLNQDLPSVETFLGTLEFLKP